MCRFVAYLGHPIVLDDILIKPKNSLIRQSIHALETNHPLNGDGIGLGWYVQEIDDKPALFRSVRPAWNEPNFMTLTPKIKTDCMFAHIRAANVGSVTHYNCHPFAYKNSLFMHNGTINGFSHIKRDLRRALCDEAYDWILGQTDSEHMFALFIHHCLQNNVELGSQDAAYAFEETIRHIQQLKQQKGIDEPDFINAVISDGRRLIAFRYVSHPELASRSLYYSVGEQYVYKDGACHMIPGNGENRALLVVSEKLTSYIAEWHEIPSQHYLIVNEQLGMKTKEIKT